MNIGSNFDDFLREEHLLEVSEDTAAKRVIAFQITQRDGTLQTFQDGVSLADELISERRAESNRPE